MATTVKRINVSLSHRDVELIEQLERKLRESKSGVIRRSVENYHGEVFKQQEGDKK